MDTFRPNRRKYFEELGEGPAKVPPSIEKAPELELKPLPSHLKYAYLEKPNKLPIIIAAKLSGEEEHKLLRVLREHKGAIG